MPLPDASAAKLKFATKTAISLTLAYMLPMALGWPQPQTAAITVMLIAATGMVSESLQKGVLRILGTILGATVGLTLIALFPQDRIFYLLSVSLAVALLLYLYNAYQGDSTLFMLAAVVTLMVFNGGDAEGAFLYGVDRTLLTAFGVVIYTLVASLLWPVKVQDNTKSMAAAVTAAHTQALSHLIDADAAQPGDVPKSQLLESMLGANQQFQAHYVSLRNEAEDIVRYRAEWDSIASKLERLNELLMPSLQTTALSHREYQKHILNYDEVLENINAMLETCHNMWSGHSPEHTIHTIELDYNIENLSAEQHLTVAAIVSRADLLLKLQASLQQLWQAESSLLFDSPGFSQSGEFKGKPTWIWLDRENFKTAIRVFISFWVAVAVWTQFNPPGGFMFVTFSTAFVVLVSYTPLPPKLLYILFTLGFIFAVPAYIFLLPQMTHWLELALFLFAYAFIGFYVFAGPLSIFFLLGLMTLGIQNTMNYNFAVILTLILLFYMICTSLLVTAHFPFTSKPNKLYISFRQRFFRTCAKLLARNSEPSRPGSDITKNMRLVNANALVAKMSQWGSMIDNTYFSGSSANSITDFNFACTVLLQQLQILAHQGSRFHSNPIIAAAKTHDGSIGLAHLCDALINPQEQGNVAETFAQATANADNIESHLSSFLGNNYLEKHSEKELAEFYLFVHLQASILAGIVQCRASSDALNWGQLSEQKF